MRITLIAGTNRQGSRTLKVTNDLARRLQQHGVETDVLDLRTLPPELFTPSAYDEKPEAFERFCQSVLTADGLYVVAPEYNGSFPGILKLFIDMLPFPESFENRPVAFLGLAAGRFGNLRGVEQLQLVFGYRNANIFPNRVFLPGVAKSLDDNGKPTDTALDERIENHLKRYIAFVQQNPMPAAVER